MSKAKRDQEGSRPVGPDEAAAVRGGDGKTKGKGGLPPEKPIVVTIKDDLISSS